MKQRMIERLMDSYNKNPDSNIAKLISILADQIRALTETFQTIDDWRDIDQAKGGALDRLGYDLEQVRGQASDEVYRILIKSKRARDLSSGDINTIINVLALSIDADPTEIKIEEMWNDPDEPEPAAIKLISIPIARLNEIELTGTQFGRLVAMTLASGISVKQIDLAGTFEFGSADLELDDKKGFSDINQEIGGFFGTVYQPADDPDLPM